MDRLSDRGSIPLRSIFKKPWKSLISGAFYCLVERKNAVLNRFRVEKLGSKLGSKSKRKSFEKSMVLECFGVLQIKKIII